jgi:hypothetical protein
MEPAPYREMSGGELQPWQERVVAEEAQLGERLRSLNVFVDGDGFAALTETEQSLLRSQRYFMSGYLETIRQRIKMFEESTA